MFTVILGVLFSCCNPEPDPYPEKPKDYREKWVGTYDFTTIDYLRYYSHDIFDTASLVLIHDTTYFRGTIKAYENNRLKITFKPDATDPDFSSIIFPLRINGILYPVVDDLGIITCSELPVGSNQTLSGSFSENEINIRYESTGPLGQAATEHHIIDGIKINK